MKLNQVIAIEKGEKARHCSDVTKLHRMSGQVALFNGMKKVYERKDEAGETFPDESVLVQANVKDVLKTVAASLTEVFNIEATKDCGNMKAVSNVMIDNKTIIGTMPATFLLFLEKQLLDMATFIEKLPTLDPAEDWTEDKESGLYKEAPRKTHKTKKVQKSLVLLAPTKEHPGQAQLIVEDETVGHWITTKLSGAIPETRKQVLLDRVNALIKAVKIAREAANNTDVEHVKVGDEIVKYLFA